MRGANPIAALVLAAVTGCAHMAADPPARFRNSAIVWRVNDRRDIPLPRTQHFHPQDYFIHSLIRQINSPLSLPLPPPAQNTNALDEVPDSTWFTNRIGHHDLSPEEIVRGPEVGDSPEAHFPWTIVSTKRSGGGPGFVIQDAIGRRYLLKMDTERLPETQSASDVIVSRILWACGYNVPDDRLVFFRRDQLRLTPGSAVVTPTGKKRRMTPRDVDRVLARAARVPGQPIRALASAFVAGKTVGGYSATGTRPGDPNDRVRHENRRDLRGYGVIASWLAQTDINESNTVDTWVADPADPQIHYLLHYLVDFGKALGVMAVTDYQLSTGFAYRVDLGSSAGQLFSLGIAARRFDGIRAPRLRGVGLFESKKFLPGRFKPDIRYEPIARMDRADGFWGAKLVMRFTRPELVRVVAEARYSDPRSAEYVLDTLIRRQRKVGLYWFSRVTPVDRFTPAQGAGPGQVSLCFTDLMTLYRLAPAAAATDYRVDAVDFAGRPVAASVPLVDQGGGRMCTAGIAAPPDHDGYVVVRITRHYQGRVLPAAKVHLARNPAGSGVRVIGVDRL